MKVSIVKVPPVEPVKEVVLTMSIDEAEEFRRLIGKTSLYGREELYRTEAGMKPVHYNAPGLGHEDILGLMWIHINDAICAQKR